MSPRPTIFISAVSKELRSARQLVANTLTFLGYEPVWQDIFGTETGDLRQMLRHADRPVQRRRPARRPMLRRGAADTRSGIRSRKLHAIRGALRPKKRQKGLVPVHGREFPDRSSTSRNRKRCASSRRPIAMFSKPILICSIRSPAAKRSKPACSSCATISPGCGEAPNNGRSAWRCSSASSRSSSSGWCAARVKPQSGGPDDRPDGEGWRHAGDDRETFREHRLDRRADPDAEDAGGALSQCARARAGRQLRSGPQGIRRISLRESRSARSVAELRRDVESAGRPRRARSRRFVTWATN